MGIRSMVQFTVRVAAFAAVAALLLQVSCMIGTSAVTTVQIETLGGSACHESAPPSQGTPDHNHVCCSGDHSPKALLSAIVMPGPLVALDAGFLNHTSALPSFALASIDFLPLFSPPHRPFALRI